MNKLSLIIIMSFLLLGVASANVNEYDSVKQGDCLLLTQTCASCTFVNVSVVYKNQTLLDNQAMSNSGALWTYSFCNTENLGRYDVSGHGDLEGTDTGFSILWFEVTSSGFDNTLGFYFIIILLSLGVILMGYYMEDSTVVILGAFGLTFVGLYILFYGIDAIKDATYTWAIGIIILCLAAYFGLRAAQESLN